MQLLSLKKFCLSTSVPRLSAGSLGTYDRLTDCTAICRAVIIFITNSSALHTLENTSLIQNSIANREFPLYINSNWRMW